MSMYDGSAERFERFHKRIMTGFGPLIERDILAAFLADYALREELRMMHDPHTSGHPNLFLDKLVKLKAGKLPSETRDAYLRLFGPENIHPTIHVYFLKRIQNGKMIDFMRSNRPMARKRKPTSLPRRTSTRARIGAGNRRKKPSKS